MHKFGTLLNRTLHLLFFCLLTTLFVGCAEKKSDESMINEQIKRLQQSIETHNRSQFMAIVDTGYHDQLNNNRKSMQRMLMGFFLRYQDISVFVSANEFEINQIRSEVISQVVLTGGKGVLPESARHYQVTSCWKKVSDLWLLSCLKWE